MVSTKPCHNLAILSNSFVQEYERVRQDLLASQRGNQPDLDWFPEGLAPVLPRDQPDLDPAVRRPRDDDHGQPDIDREGGGAPLDDEGERGKERVQEIPHLPDTEDHRWIALPTSYMEAHGKHYFALYPALFNCWYSHLQDEHAAEKRYSRQGDVLLDSTP
ncbi:hypothetical protein ACJJTC_016089 [Scirpophaga incertulas]